MPDEVTKYFHITDVLSLTTGFPLSKLEAMTMPDGTVRDAYEASMDGVISLVSFLTGLEYGDQSDPEQYDDLALQFASVYAEEDLYKQYAAFAAIMFPTERFEMLGTRRQRIELMASWMKYAEEEFGGEWVEITQPSQARLSFVQAEVKRKLAPAGPPAWARQPGVVFN